MNLFQFRNFCFNKQWKLFSIYNIINVNKTLIGILGNSDPQYIYDWTKIIADEFFPDIGAWDEETFSCVFPSKIELQILFDRASSPEFPVNYILGSQIKSFNSTIFFPRDEFGGVSETMTIDVGISFSLTFVDGNKPNIFSSLRPNPSIFPNLPMDIVNPFSS